MGLFRAAHGCGEAKRSPVLKICHTYPTMMKLSTVIPYLMKIQKIYKSRDTPLSFADISISVHEFTNKILSCCLNYIVDMFMRPKSDNSSTSMREIIITSIL